MSENIKKIGSRVYPWRFLIESYQKFDELPFYQHFFKTVNRNRLIRSNEILWREIYGYPYIENLVGDIYSEKIHGKRCLDNWLFNKEMYKDDGTIQASIIMTVKNYVISIGRKKRLRVISLEDTHDGHIFDATQNFETPERILDIKEFTEELFTKKSILYGRLNSNQIYIFENSKKFNQGDMTYSEVAKELELKETTVQEYALKIKKVIKEILKD